MPKKNSELFSSILYIVLGVLLVIFRSQTLNWAMTIAGVFFIVSGALDFVKQNWSSGAVSLIIGLAVLVLGWLATAIVLLVLGILIAVKGGVALWNELKGGRPAVLNVVFPALTIVLGLMLAFGNGLDVIIIVVGVLLAIDGVLGLLGEYNKTKK